MNIILHTIVILVYIPLLFMYNSTFRSTGELSFAMVVFLSVVLGMNIVGLFFGILSKL